MIPKQKKTIPIRACKHPKTIITEPGRWKFSTDPDWRIEPSLVSMPHEETCILCGDPVTKPQTCSLN